MFGGGTIRVEYQPAAKADARFAKSIIRRLRQAQSALLVDLDGHRVRADSTCQQARMLSSVNDTS